MKPSLKKTILLFLPAWAHQFIPLRHPHGWIELIEDIANDNLVKKGKVFCLFHLFFIAGLPKSGTTWIEQLFGQTPGLVQLNKSSLRAFPRLVELRHPHDMTPEMLTCAPRNRLSFLKLHLNPYPRNFEILESLGIRTVVLIRDLRDMLISRFHHVMCQDSHWDYQRLMKIPPALRLFESMKALTPEGSGTITHYYALWISGWLQRAKQKPEETMIIKYEEMHSDIFSSLRRIYMFYGYQITNEGIRRVIAKQKRKYNNDEKRDLKKNLGQSGRAVSTFREGKPGAWRRCFDEQMKTFLREQGGQVLIEAGYEKDLDW